MKCLGKLLAATFVFGGGYFCGTFNAGGAVPLAAVPDQESAASFSRDTLVAYKSFVKGSRDLSDSLSGENLNQPAMPGVNYFALSVGGIDAVRELEEGRGVDPETFAAVYADRANPELSQYIDTDPEGRKRFKGTVIRMYSQERLKELFQRRDQLEIRSSRVGG